VKAPPRQPTPEEAALQLELALLEEKYRPNSAVDLALIIFFAGVSFGFFSWFFFG
jgi:hypothetical protein